MKLYNKLEKKLDKLKTKVSKITTDTLIDKVGKIKNWYLSKVREDDKTIRTESEDGFDKALKEYLSKIGYDNLQLIKE